MKAKPQKWPADAVERRAVSALKPYKANARTHSPEQVAQIAASIREWGWTQPILVDEKNGVIAGHGRLEAAKSLGVDEVPVIVARGWTAVQKRAYVLADNQLALNAGWDHDLLRIEIGGLQDVFDTSLLGFDREFVAGLMATGEGLTDPDDAPEAPAEPVTRLGDVWTSGGHRLICGDSTDAETVARVLAGATPHLMVTDPPYGVDYDPTWRHEAAAKGLIGFSAKRDGKVDNDDRVDWREAWSLFSGAVAYVWHAGRHASEVQASLEAADFEIRSQVIWAKDSFSISRGHYHWQHEPCWYAVRKGSKGHWSGDRSQSTLWKINKSDGQDQGNHGTQKPVECMRRPIVNNSRAGDAVYDPFIGSGTTMIAAEMTGRRCYGIELSPAYCDVVVKRWEAFTGKEATLDGDGRTFEEISLERETKQAAE